jgi:uncharacterized membrane protein YbaN (DUF454 family)
MLKTAKKYIFIALGSLSVALGVIGIFIPVLPTTPFLLLAVFFYLRSSKKLYEWLLQHRVFGTYIYNYITYKAVLKSTKIFAEIFLWSGLIISMILVNSWHIRALLLIVGVAVSMHILTLKTIEKSELKKFKEPREARET